MSEHDQNTVNRCLYLDAGHNLTIRKESVPVPAADQVLVAVKANGICGSDVHFYEDGRLGNFVVDQPYIPGHEASGEIVACGEDVSHLKPGDAVVIEPGVPCGHCEFCRKGRYNLCPDVVFLSAPPINGTFCDYLTIRADSVFKMPDGLSFAAAAMAEPAAVAVHSVQRARFALGDTALVVGAGPIGLLVLQAFRAAGGGPVSCLDLQPARLACAEKLGAKILELDTDEQFDVVFDTSGSAKACSGLFKHARPGGCVVQVGWPAGNVVEMDIAVLIERELDYVAVNRYANAFPAAMQMIADGRIKTDLLMTHTFSFDEAAHAFEMASKASSEVIKAVVIN